MKLKTWLFKNRIKISHFAEDVDVSRWYIHKWFHGVVPSHSIMERVRMATNGEVYKIEDLKDEIIGKEYEKKTKSL
jgi:asparagine synthetase B (glutamine-hydrolysing)